MKNITKRIIAVFAVLAVAAMSFTGCSGKNNNEEGGDPSGNGSSNSSSADEEPAPMQYPFVVGSASEGNGLTPGDPNADLYGNDPVADGSSSSSGSNSSGNSSGNKDNKKEPATEIIEATEADGQPATKIIVVTEANGEKATDAQGEEVTEVVRVTEIVTKAAGSAAVVTEVVEATEADGQPATKVVPVTEANGEKATDAQGEEVTEVVKVTEIVTKPADTESGDTETTSSDNSESSDISDGNGDETSESEGGNSEGSESEGGDSSEDKPVVSDYTPNDDGRYAMWLDISKDENFYFEDEMIKATFKVKEGIPDGDYKVRISPDLSDVAGVAIYPEKVIDGIIRVNNGEIEAVDVSGETGMIFYGDNIACKQGDTIDFNINIKNNTGLVAFCIWFYFDSNALEFIDASPTGEFEDISNSTDVGGGKNAN